MTRPWTCPVCNLHRTECPCGVDRRDGLCGGRWVVRGTRVWLRSIRSLREHALISFPHIEREQLTKALTWLDHPRGASALLEEELEDLAGDVARSEELLRMAALCHQTPNGLALFRKWLDRAAEDALRAQEVKRA